MTARRAVVVGAGPNGLAAAITLAEAGYAVEVLEAEGSCGGGARTRALTLPGVRHDVCSAVHPLALGSPCFRRWPLERHGLRWVQPPLPLAHPLDGGDAATLPRALEEAAEALGDDASAYADLVGPIVNDWARLEGTLLGPPLRWPAHPLAALRFARHGVRSAVGLARRFRGPRARALTAGLAAHSMQPLERLLTGAFALVLAALAHRVGWPSPRGGAGAITDALVAHLATLGGRVTTDRRVTSLDELPPARLVLLDVGPHQLARIAGERLPRGYRRRLARYRYGPGVFKLDAVLAGPVPWRAEACARAGTVHLGGTLEEIAAAEREVAGGGVPERPFVLLAQPSLFDETRAPAGQHIIWAYTHVPCGAGVDMTSRIEAQIERFAPGFGDRVLARHTMGPRAFETYDANYVGGDINGGTQDLCQTLARPVLARTPYRTPLEGVYLCSASTPPGGGVHGMCGHLAALVALADDRA